MGNGPSTTSKVNLKEERYRYIESLIENESDASGESNGHETCDDEDDVSIIDPKDYYFPFENLVFEGGGAKGAAYWGAIKYLEDIGLMPNIKRLAGTSIGSIAASCLAVGLSSMEVKKYMDQDIDKILYDSYFLAFLPNMLSHYGCHRGDKFDRWFGSIIEMKTGSADITFDEVLRKYGRELCIVVTNLNLMKPEYCHPKTTPDMPIRLAVRMSISIPGLFAAKQHNLHGEAYLMVDGAITCPFPLHCFDGWYLSMAKEDNFFKRLRGDLQGKITTIYENGFKEEVLNMKTLGVSVFAENEGEALRLAMEERVRKVVPEKPEKETKLYKNWMKKKLEDRKVQRVHEQFSEAVIAFLKVLEKHNLDGNNVIDRRELENVLRDEFLSSPHAELIFGKEEDLTDVLDVLDHNEDSQVHYNELIAFLEDMGMFLHNRYFGYKHTITGISSFANSIVETVLLNMTKVHFKPRDVERTIGINTGYVGTTDFHFEKEDKDFLMNRGYNSCRAFLQRFIVENQLKKKEDAEIEEKTSEDIPKEKEDAEIKEKTSEDIPKEKEDAEIEEKTSEDIPKKKEDAESEEKTSEDIPKEKEDAEIEEKTSEHISKEKEDPESEEKTSEDIPKKKENAEIEEKTSEDIPKKREDAESEEKTSEDFQK